MGKKSTELFANSTKEFIDPMTHEFTLVALSELSEEIYKLERKVNKLKFKNSFYFLVSMLGAYCVYDNLNMRLKKIKKNESKEETK